MNADDDDGDDDDKGMSASRYPCMPSLVALQQMRNRLHLAHLGKKLMKWTAQATVRELRRISLDITTQFERFEDEIRDAFILLARSRFYQPMLNEIVLENVPKAARLHITTNTRSVSGVKLYVLEVVELPGDPYSCLGLEKGGQTITETKVAWRNLLKKMVFIAELRKSFTDVDVANKTANKRCNVIKKHLIPKLKATIAYILSELEERERQEIFRIKQFKKLKDRRNKKNEKKGDHICACCLKKKKEIANKLCDICLIQHSGMKKKEIIKVTKPYNLEENKIDTKQPLESPTNQINEVIGLTTVIARKVSVPKSTNKFIKTSSAANEKIEDAVGNLLVCDACKQEMMKLDKIEITQVITPAKTPAKTPAITPAITPIITPKSGKSIASICSKKTVEEQIDSGIYNLGSESTNQLGYFEKKFKEIVKVTRLQNDDGTISEEKQVITIRTERRNPMKRGGGNDDLGSGGYDGDSKKNFRFPRNSKSDHTSHSDAMGQLKLRPCMSAGFQKSNQDSSTSCNASNACSVKSSSSCGLKRASSGNKTQVTREIVNVTRSRIPPCTSTSSAQTCCKELWVVKPAIPAQETVEPCSCHGDAVKPKKSEDNKAVCFKTTGTDALWRDACCSTTQLVNTEPSRLFYDTKEIGKEPIVKCNDFSITCINCGNTGRKPLPALEKPVKYRLKIVPKATEPEPQEICRPYSPCRSPSPCRPPPPCCPHTPCSKPPPPKDNVCSPKEKPNKEKTDQQKEICLQGSLLDILKSLILPKESSKNSSAKVAFTEPDKPKVICKSCISKLSSFVAYQDLDSQSVLSNSSSCKYCQASPDRNEQDSSSLNSSVSMPESTQSCSCKSFAVGASSEIICCQPKSKPSSCSGMCLKTFQKPAEDSEAESSSSSLEHKYCICSAKQSICGVRPPDKHKKLHICCTDKDKDEYLKTPSCCTLAAKLSEKSSKSGKSPCFQSKQPNQSNDQSEYYESRKSAKSPCCQSQQPNQSNDQSECCKSQKSAKSPCFQSKQPNQSNDQSEYYESRKSAKSPCCQSQQSNQSNDQSECCKSQKSAKSPCFQPKQPNQSNDQSEYYESRKSAKSPCCQSPCCQSQQPNQSNDQSECYESRNSAKSLCCQSQQSNQSNDQSVYCKSGKSAKSLCCQSQQASQSNDQSVYCKSGKSAKSLCCQSQQSNQSNDQSECYESRKSAKSLCCQSQQSKQSNDQSVNSKSGKLSKSTCCETRDISTSTKRNDQFDVRPLKTFKSAKKSSTKNKKICTCQSEPIFGCDTHIQNCNTNSFFKGSKSCQDNLELIFRW